MLTQGSGDYCIEDALTSFMGGARRHGTMLDLKLLLAAIVKFVLGCKLLKFSLPMMNQHGVVNHLQLADQAHVVAFFHQNRAEFRARFEFQRLTFERRGILVVGNQATGCAPPAVGRPIEAEAK
jgi:hypothetical protein